MIDIIAIKFSTPNIPKLINFFYCKLGSDEWAVHLGFTIL